MNSHKFIVGAFECYAISDGIYIYEPPTFPAPDKLLFGNVPQNQLKQALLKHSIHPQSWSGWISPYICLLINTGEHLVLIDTGANDLDPNTGKLIQNLKARGINPEDIDFIIITHCHPDHINGIILADGEIAFPNAQYFMWEREWEFWNSGEAETKLHEHFREVLLSFFRKNVIPIKERLRLIKEDIEILPGIKVIFAPGHTPGHIALLISSEGENLLNIADTVLHPIHLQHTDWHAATDFNPNQVTTTRRRLINLAASEKLLVLAFHFPFPGLGYIVPEKTEWKWQPI